MRACARTGRSMRPPDPEASPLAQIQKLLLHPDVSVQRAALDALQVDIFFMSSFSLSPDVHDSRSSCPVPSLASGRTKHER